MSKVGNPYPVRKSAIYPAVILSLVVIVGLSAAGGEADPVAKRPPKPIHTVAPEHPADLYEQGVSGKVVVRFVVDRMGTVKNPEIVSASHQEFVAPTLTALEQWRFEPGLKDGLPADIRVSIPFDFKIPLDQQLKRIMGREIFVEIDGPIVPARDLDEIPAPEKWLAAPYPDSLIGSGRSGRAIISFVISKEGLVVNPEISKADREEFAIAALLAVCRLRYPVIRDGDGDAIFVRASIEYPFEDPGAVQAGKPE